MRARIGFDLASNQGAKGCILLIPLPVPSFLNFVYNFRDYTCKETIPLVNAAD